MWLQFLREPGLLSDNELSRRSDTGILGMAQVTCENVYHTLSFAMRAKSLTIFFLS